MKWKFDVKDAMCKVNAIKT